MSAHTKKHHTEPVAKISWHGALYAVPLKVMAHYKIDAEHENDIEINTLFDDLIQTHGEPGALLKGLRYREGLTQIDLAQKLKISQANLSAMENNKRAIGKTLAKRIASNFHVDYKLFL